MISAFLVKVSLKIIVYWFAENLMSFVDPMTSEVQISSNKVLSKSEIGKKELRSDFGTSNTVIHKREDAARYCSFSRIDTNK